MDNVDYFDAYVRCGLRPIPLHAATKIPVLSDWQLNWSADKYRNFFITYPACNIGILLGNIIDVEGDDKVANDEIIEMSRNTPHPMYRSNKSVHHLFLSPDPSITFCRVGMIEFRGRRHQSAIPPSIHESGVKYAWLKESVFPAPPMPTKLSDFLYAHKKFIRREVKVKGKKSNHITTACNKCKRKSYIHKKRLVLEVRAFRVLGSLWQCQKCRTVDIRPLCREIRDQIP